jgi:hypothetical protein
VTGVVAALETGYNVGIFGQQIDNFTFPFIAPLGADDHKI